MPKIIAQLRGEILSNARRLLFSQGYDEFTMRSVAAACHVAVGTVYNYFPSKVILAAEVILEDWRAALLRMDASQVGETPLEGLGRIFEELMVFYDTYDALWKEYAASNTAPLRGAYHLQLVEQLGEKIAAVLAPCAPLCSDALPGFLAETLLDAADQGRERFEELRPILERLL